MPSNFKTPDKFEDICGYSNIGRKTLRENIERVDFLEKLFEMKGRFSPVSNFS